MSAGASTLSKAVQSRENMQPAVPRPEQERVAAKKLAELYASIDKLPNDRYYGFIDQTSFLLDDQEKSNRDAVYFWWGNELMPF